MNDTASARRGRRDGKRPTPTPWQTYKRLLGYVRPYRGHFTLALLGGVLFSATMTSFAFLARELGDRTLRDLDPKSVYWVPLALVGLFFLRGIGDFTQTYFMGYVGRHLVRQMRRDVYRHVLGLPIDYFDHNASATLLSRLTYNTEQVGQATTDSLNVLVRTTLTIIGCSPCCCT